jgi:hypothetical protein
MFQVHVFLHRLRVELALMREFRYRSALDCFVDEFRMLADKLAKFRQIGIVHFRCESGERKASKTVVFV